jgi:hypothetical protein
LHRRLQAGGFLAFTTHGRYVVDRIGSGEKTYGAANAGMQVVIDYDKVGYGFAPYQGMPHYGISATRVRNVDDMLAEAKLRALTYVERGWVKHQDFFSCCR